MPELVLAGLAFIFGACVGSFVSVVSFRLPRELSIITPRSFCPACGQALPTLANVPLLGYVFLRGRCAMCRGVISLRYPLTELALGTAAMSLSLRFEVGDALARFSLCAALMAVALIDLDWRIVPDAISLPGIAAGVLCATFLISGMGLMSSLLGVLVGAGLLWTLGEAYRLARGREGLGFGDVKLLGMVGAYLGWPGALFTIFFGSLIGSLSGLMFAVAVSRWPDGAKTYPDSRTGAADRLAPAENPPSAARAKDQLESVMEPHASVCSSAAQGLRGLMQTQIPFAPFLSLAAAAYAIFQPELSRWYLGE